MLSKLNLRFLFGAVLAIAILPSAAFAQAKLMPVYEVNRNGINGEYVSGLNGNKNYLLSSFYFSFKNGDHKIKTIGLELDKEARTNRIAFADQNSDDPYLVNARFLEYHSSNISRVKYVTRDEYGLESYGCEPSYGGLTFSAGVQRAICSQNLNLSGRYSPFGTIGSDPRINANEKMTHIPVLTGFYFDRRHGDANIAGIVFGTCNQCNEPTEKRETNAAMTDIGGNDFRDLNSMANHRARIPKIRVSQAIIPVGTIKTCRVEAGRLRSIPQTNRVDMSAGIAAPPWRSFRVAAPRQENVVLTYVELWFTDNQDRIVDHHLGDFGIFYDTMGEFRVTFADNDPRDDKVRYRFEYCVLE